MLNQKLPDATGRKTIRDLRGQIFGRLEVVELILDPAIKALKKSTLKSAAWRCVCECGGESVVAATCLLKGCTKSCGCLNLETKSRLGRSRGGYNSKPDSGMRRVYRQYGYDAKKRGLEFSLTQDQFLHLTSQNCCYCDSKPSAVYQKRQNQKEFIYNGIDRRDNTQGYVMENCVPCCKHCNHGKFQRTEKEFAEWACRLVDFWARSHNESSVASMAGSVSMCG